jgi:WD40 repeat protein
MVRSFATGSVRAIDLKRPDYEFTDRLAFAPDSRTCCFTGMDFLYAIDAVEGRPVFKRMIADRWDRPRAQRPAVSADGRECLTGSFGETRSDNLRLWSVAAGQPLRTFAGHLGGISAVAFCPGGAQVASAGKTDGAVRFWDLGSGRQVRAIWGDAAGFENAAFSRDTGSAISWGDDGVIRVSDLSDADVLQTLVGSFHEPVQSLAISPDGRRLALGGLNRLAIWDATNGNVLSDVRGEWYKPCSRADLDELAFSPDARWIAAGAAQGQVWLFRGDNGQPVGQLGSHDRDVRSVRFTADGRRVISNNGNTLRAWRVPSGEMAWSSRGDATLAHGLGLAADGRTVVAMTTHGHLGRFDLNTGGGPSRWVQLEAPDHLEQRFVYLRGASALVGGVGSELMLWDVASGKSRRRFTGRPAEATGVAVSPDERWLASGAMDGTVTVWDLRTGREVHTFEGHTGPVRRLAFAPSGDRLYSAGDAGQVRCWDFTRPKAYRDFVAKLADARLALQRSPDDPQALATLADWYSFRHRDDWAAELRARALAR